MNRSRSEPLTLEDQLRLSRNVATLVRARLPLVGELLRTTQASQLGGETAAVQVEEGLASGRSLAQTLASDSSRNSQILAACIEAGEQSDSLDRILENWCEMNIANQRDDQATRTAMVYPVLLMLVATLSLAYSIRSLIPEYQKTYQMFFPDLPIWMDVAVWFHKHLGLSVFFIASLPLVACIGWLWRRRTLNRMRMPRMPARRLRLQVLATNLAAELVAAGGTVENMATLATRSMGARDIDVQQVATRLAQQQPLLPLPTETSLVLATLHAGLISQSEAAKHLRTIAEHLSEEAKISIAREIHLVPVVVSLVVGGLTVVTYVGLVYMPWILLMRRIVAE